MRKKKQSKAKKQRLFDTLQLISVIISIVSSVLTILSLLA